MMKEKKSQTICLVSRAFNPGTQGLGRYGADLLSALQNIRNNIKITTIECKYKSSYGYLFFILVQIFFKKKNADIYHALTPLECLYLPPEKTIVTIHDLILVFYLYRFKNINDKSWLSDIFKYILFLIACRKAAKCKKIIAISEDTKKDFIDLTGCDPNKIIIIDNCVHDKYKKNKRYKNKYFTIGTLSAIDKRKRVKQLIENFMQIKNKNLRLIIGGDGPEKAKLEKIAQNDSRITFLGFVKEENMVEFYQKLDLFVFPSSCEGFGIPIIEAARSCRPVFTLKDAIIPKNVVLCSKQITWQSFRDDIIEIMEDNEKWEKLANYCYENSTRFDKKHFVRNMFNLYDTHISHSNA